MVNFEAANANARANDAEAEVVKLKEKLSRIEDHCIKTMHVYRGGMDASTLAEDIVEIIKEVA